MKVVAINGSPKPNGNTSVMLNRTLAELEKEGIGTELVQIGGRAVRGCTACTTCFKEKNMRCIIDDDPVNEIVAKMAEADALIMGSPVYFADLTSELKALIDRSGFIFMANGNPMRRKPGAAVVVARRGGQVHTYDSINHFFGILEMVTVGSSYWNMGVALKPGAVKEDAEAGETMRVLGQNMAWLLKKIKA